MAKFKMGDIIIPSDKSPDTTQRYKILDVCENNYLITYAVGNHNYGDNPRGWHTDNTSSMDEEFKVLHLVKDRRYIVDHLDSI